MVRDRWLRVGLSLARGGELVPWLIATGVLLVMLGVAIVARGCA